MIGKLIVLEGPDGSGKSTAAQGLVKFLRDKGYDVILTREPGGTFIAEEIRSLILTERKDEQMVPMTELLLFAAGRAQHIATVIKPAIAEGKIVVCDRFSDSTYAYQGTGRGYIDEVLALENLVHKGFEPDYTLFFHVTLEESIARLNSRLNESNRLDVESIEFKTKIFNGYNKRYKDKQYRMHSIDAMVSISKVLEQVSDWVNNKFVPGNPIHYFTNIVKQLDLNK